MTLYEEIYFEITFSGVKSELKKMVKFLKSGELDEFFEISSDYINYDDNYAGLSDEEETELVFTNDEIGIEIDEFDAYDFLDVFCKAAASLDVSGSLYDIDDNEFSFSSPEGDASYRNSKAPKRFNDELDDVALEEESGEDEE